jgi:flagellar basal body-associated protein FliL
MLRRKGGSMKTILLAVIAAFALSVSGASAYAGNEKTDQAAPGEKGEKKPDHKKSKKGAGDTGTTPPPK